MRETGLQVLTGAKLATCIVSVRMIRFDMELLVPGL